MDSTIAFTSHNLLLSHIKQQELAKWQKGVSLTLDDKSYMSLFLELGADTGDVYAY